MGREASSLSPGLSGRNLPEHRYFCWRGCGRRIFRTKPNKALHVGRMREFAESVQISTPPPLKPLQSKPHERRWPGGGEVIIETSREDVEASRDEILSSPLLYSHIPSPRLPRRSARVFRPARYYLPQFGRVRGFGEGNAWVLFGFVRLLRALPRGRKLCIVRLPALSQNSKAPEARESTGKPKRVFFVADAQQVHCGLGPMREFGPHEMPARRLLGPTWKN